MNNDLISRKALKDVLKTELANVPQPDTDADYYVGVKQGLKLAETIIDNAPTVEAYTEEDMKRTIKENFDIGYEMAKNKYERPQVDLISREALKKACAEVVKSSNNSDFIPCPTWNDAMEIIGNAPTVEERISYVQQAVNTIMHDSTGDSDVDKAFRNAARLIQNAIDGETPEFEHIERDTEKAKESEIIKAYTKGFDTGVETVKGEKSLGECEKCNFRKFSETFVDVLADAMNKKGITSAEQFQEILKGGAE